MVVLNEIFSEQAKTKIEALHESVYQRLGGAINVPRDPMNFHITLSKQDEIFNIAIQTLQVGNLAAVIAPFGLLFFVFGAGKIAGLISNNVVRNPNIIVEATDRATPFSRSTRY